MLLEMQEAMGDDELGELAYPWRVDFELMRGRTFLLLLAHVSAYALVNLRLCAEQVCGGKSICCRGCPTVGTTAIGIRKRAPTDLHTFQLYKMIFGKWSEKR